MPDTPIRKFGIQYGGLHGVIYGGRINKAQTEFLDGKENCTGDALVAVAEFIRAQGADNTRLNVTNGRKQWRITVTEVEA